MELESHFFDTYALLGVIMGNPGYRRYGERIAIVTTRFNLMEMYYCLLRDYDKESADRHYDRLRPYALEVSDDVIKEAMEFRLAKKNKKMSYVDCIGYIFAGHNKIKFLTGDKAFKDLPGVEYVK